ncbi:hypothetical protein NUW54_g8279 [Trametes sanguinea]|uniref:Uncharacterized protein n=1 Tax=Trametes sanguinea TaxID=158606 RepID=A0ACC1PFT5_9APHY|nr:hypothetical protein NUW54_g8279 [Trametes sanguinea]
MLPSTQEHPSPELLGIAREGIGLPNTQYFGFGRTFRLVDLQSLKADTIHAYRLLILIGRVYCCATVQISRLDQSDDNNGWTDG